VKKLVAVIVATTAILMFAPTAYASDGDLDTTWGGDGVVVSTHATESAAYAIANYPGDRVLVVGWVTDSTASRILVNRFLADGSADTSCNGTGEFIDTVNDAVASDVVVLSDGSFVITGTMQINNKGTLFVAKFTSTCNLDANFGTAGIATYSALLGTSGRALVVQSDGKIVVVGDESSTVSDSSDKRILITRFSDLGILDTSFGSNGRFISSTNEKGQAQDVVIDSSGRIIFTGSIVGTVAPGAAIVGRLTITGSLDTSFATQGYLINEFNGDPRLNAIAIRPNGNLVAVGTYGGPFPSTQQSPIVVCLTQAGAFDSDCGVDGWTYLPTLNSDVYADDVVVTADNAILLSGMSESIDPAPMVMRLDHTGVRDNNFGSSGTWLGTDLTGRMYSLAIQADGRILSAGNDEEIGLSSLIVIRLNNTITPQSTTVPTTTIAIETSTTIPATTIPANQLPATGHDDNGLGFAMAFFGIGILLLGMRRRALR
jgi:uncharacterized delta-60 repeat protein